MHFHHLIQFQQRDGILQFLKFSSRRGIQTIVPRLCHNWNWTCWIHGAENKSWRSCRSSWNRKCFIERNSWRNSRKVSFILNRKKTLKKLNNPLGKMMKTAYIKSMYRWFFLHNICYINNYKPRIFLRIMLIRLNIEVISKL